MTAQDFTQSRMGQVRRRVIAPRRVALLNIDFSSDIVANLQSSFLDFNLVNDQTLSRRISIEHRRNEVRTACGSGRAPNAANIPDLTAGLGVERRLIENDFAFIAFIQIRNFFIAADHGQHFRIIDSSGFVTLE